MKGGMLVTNPIPEEYSMDPDVINKAIDEAIAEAKAQGIHGKADHALPAGKGQGAHRRRQPGFQHSAGIQQCRTGCENRLRAVQDGLIYDRMRGTTDWLPLFLCVSSEPYKTVSFPAQNVSQIHGTAAAAFV